MNENELDISRLGTIVSRTNIHGTIIDVNEAFIEASGYEREELIGQPHNILRHPDVPKKVFADLWLTLQAGKPWVQIVKNRCKDGRYYWVEANVTPVLEQGQVVGYLSVRRAVNTETKLAATQLYKDIERGHKIITNGYILDRLQKMCLFNYFHPINIMLVMIALLASTAVLATTELVTIPVEGVVLLSTLCFLYAYAGKKYVFARLGLSKVLIENMRQGDFTGQVNTYGSHSLSNLTNAVKMMQVQLGAMYDDGQEKLNRSTRLKSALDNTSSKVMMVSPKGTIIYLNDEMADFFKDNALQISEFLPKFDADDLIEHNLSAVFFDIPELATLENSQTFETIFAGFNLKISFKPVLSDQQSVIGYVIEWQDLTQQRNIEKRLKSTLEMASLGHTDLHLDTHGLDGFFLDTSNNINLLLSSLNAIIEDMVFVMNNLATGNVETRVVGELQGSLAAMKGATNVSLDNLSAIIWYIKQASGTVSIAAHESSKASLDLSTRTQQAAATLEEINATMQNVNDLQAENSKELIGVSHLAEQAVGENEKAEQSLNSTIDAIEDIQNTSEQISNIIGLIDGIAFQTNLLALNAAVEAARAGEHGRGFAVVAGEVRSLAQKSADAAKDIKELIDDSSLKVKQGVEKVQETRSAFTIVNEGVSQIGLSLDNVVQSISQQQHSVVEVSQAINTLDSNIQNNAVLVEQTSVAATSLKEQAELLNNETNKFKINETLTQGLIQNTPAIHGIQIADVRQTMRIWRANVQSFLNGVRVVIDLDKAIDDTKCGTGKALAQMVTAEPGIMQMREYQNIQLLHTEQHQLVRSILAIKDKGLQGDFEMMANRDELLDKFGLITDQLDKALYEFNSAYFRNTQLVAA